MQFSSLGQHYTDMKGSKYMLVHSLASKYARFVVLGRLMYWTPPPHQTIGPPLLKSDDLFFREPRDIGPSPFKNPGHAPGFTFYSIIRVEATFIGIVLFIHHLNNVQKKITLILV